MSSNNQLPVILQYAEEIDRSISNFTNKMFDMLDEFKCTICGKCHELCECDSNCAGEIDPDAAENAAEYMEQMKNGTYTVDCPSCNGLGEIPDPIVISTSCWKCDGKGVLNIRG